MKKKKVRFKSVKLDVEVLNNENYKIVYDLYQSKDVNNIIIAQAIEKELGISYDDYVDDNTIKALNVVTNNYKYVGVRTLTPYCREKREDAVYLYPQSLIQSSIVGEPLDLTLEHNSKEQRGGHIDGWPAIWSAAKAVGLGSCGNSHQYQINSALSTGLYRNIKGKWYKIKEIKL